MEITKEYLILFNAITDTVQTLELLQSKLISSQQLSEEMYINNSVSPEFA